MLDKDTMLSRLEFCNAWVRYGKAENKRTFQKCVWVDETWFRGYW